MLIAILAIRFAPVAVAVHVPVGRQRGSGVPTAWDNWGWFRRTSRRRGYRHGGTVSPPTADGVSLFTAFLVPSILQMGTRSLDQAFITVDVEPMGDAAFRVKHRLWQEQVEEQDKIMPRQFNAGEDPPL